MSADTRTDEELLDAARNGDEDALAVLVERHRDRLKRMVRLRMDRRLQGRVDPADVVQDAYLAVRGQFPQYSADPRVPFFLWLRLEVGQKLVDVHRFHLGTSVRDAGQEVSLHGKPSQQPQFWTANEGRWGESASRTRSGAHRECGEVP